MYFESLGMRSDDSFPSYDFSVLYSLGIVTLLLGMTQYRISYLQPWDKFLWGQTDSVLQQIMLIIMLKIRLIISFLFSICFVKKETMLSSSSYKTFYLPFLVLQKAQTFFSQDPFQPCLMFESVERSLPIKLDTSLCSTRAGTCRAHKHQSRLGLCLHQPTVCVSVIEGKGFIRVACCVYKFLCSQHNAAKNGGKAVSFFYFSFFQLRLIQQRIYKQSQWLSMFSL